MEYAFIDSPSIAGRLDEKARTKNVEFSTLVLRYLATTLALSVASLLFGIRPTIWSAWPSIRMDDAFAFFNFKTNSLKVLFDALSS
jgi:hypothetical protein